MIVLFGCSRLQKRHDGDAEATVPKHMYDSLLRKYADLQEKYQSIDIQNQPSQTEESETLAETVDVFANADSDKTEGRTLASPDASAEPPPPSVTERDISSLREAIALVDKKLFEQATLDKFLALEKSQVSQVRVRAKFYTGEVLFQQGKYDLAMQAFEEIIQREAFSGIVQKALERLITCSEKLGVEDKREKYYSMLHDFFVN